MDANLKGPAFGKDDFPNGSGLRVWEFGVGDAVGLPTGTSLRRVGDGRYEVTAESPFRIRLGGAKLRASVDGQVWRDWPMQADNWAQFQDAELAGGRLFIEAVKE